ncbi:hypothetical protein Q1695_012979 [Nippostrongylus brasiliensis]|nr:hypothetical protein Q1695_012979 [Nippostrongylus brasiliensis]
MNVCCVATATMQQDEATSSSDEEVLFTKEMVRRLKKTSAQLAASRPTSSLSDTSGVSTMSTASVHKSRSDDHAEVTSTDSALPTNSPSKEGQRSEELIVTPRYL